VPHAKQIRSVVQPLHTATAEGHGIQFGENAFEGGAVAVASEILKEKRRSADREGTTGL
jgi:hypothetical protein